MKPKVRAIKSRRGDYDFYVFEHKDRPWVAHMRVAVASDGVDLLIDDLWTQPDSRRKGYARMMLEQLDVHKVTKTCVQTLLVYTNNEEAIALYESVGFEKAVRVPNLYHIGDNIFVMTKQPRTVQ